MKIISTQYILKQTVCTLKELSLFLWMAVHSYKVNEVVHFVRAPVKYSHAWASLTSHQGGLMGLSFTHFQHWAEAFDLHHFLVPQRMGSNCVMLSIQSLMNRVCNILTYVSFYCKTYFWMFYTIHWQFIQDSLEI